MNEPDDRIDRRLAELAKLTESIGPRGGFTERVLLAVLAEGVFTAELGRAGRRLILLAAVGAIVGAAWAISSEHSSNEALAAADEIVELPW
jgi:hypothetical protein